MIIGCRLVFVTLIYLLLLYYCESAKSRAADISVTTNTPSYRPTIAPSYSPRPSFKPTHDPTHKPTHKPSEHPTFKPTHEPTIVTPPDHHKLIDVIIGFTTAIVLFSLGLLAFQNISAPPSRRQPTIIMSSLGGRRNDSGSFPGSYQSLDNSASQEAPLVDARVSAV